MNDPERKRALVHVYASHSMPSSLSSGLSNTSIRRASLTLGVLEVPSRDEWCERSRSDRRRARFQDAVELSRGAVAAADPPRDGDEHDPGFI